VKHEIKIIDNTGNTIDTIEIKSDPAQFIMHRGRLLVRVEGPYEGFYYREHSYLEVY
jgi:hypothetical protein